MPRAAQGDRLEALYVLAVHTGMRQGELLALKWPDVDLRDGRVSVRRTITKSGGRLLARRAEDGQEPPHRKPHYRQLERPPSPP